MQIPQDGTPPSIGTVTSGPWAGWFTVKWDATKDESAYRYRMGSEGKYDLDLAEGRE